MGWLALSHKVRLRSTRNYQPPPYPWQCKGVAGSEYVNGWEKAKVGGLEPGTSSLQGGCNRSIVEAEVVAEEGENKRDRSFLGALHDGVRSPGASAAPCKSPPPPGQKE